MNLVSNVEKRRIYTASFHKSQEVLQSEVEVLGGDSVEQTYVEKFSEAD